MTILRNQLKQSTNIFLKETILGDFREIDHWTNHGHDWIPYTRCTGILIMLYLEMSN